MIVMLFHLFCMFDDFWRMNRRSQDSDGKSVFQMQYSRRSENPRKNMEVPIFPEGPHHPLARATRWCGHPGPPLALLFGV